MNRLATTAAASLLLLLTGCTAVPSRKPAIEVWDDMRRQPKYRTQAYSPLFADNHETARYPVPGTIARGYLKEDDAFYTGVVNGNYVTKNPLPLNMETLKLGQQRFNTYCSPCHGRTGSGQGVVTQRASWIASNLYEDRVAQFSDGDIFDVISHGRRTMPGYRYQIVERDRWAIVAYVRALQRAEHGSVNDVPQELRTELR